MTPERFFDEFESFFKYSYLRRLKIYKSSLFYKNYLLTTVFGMMKPFS